MSYMFYNSCLNASNIDLDLSNINSNNVTNMNGLFYKTGSNSTIFILNLDNYDTSQVYDMAGMFSVIHRLEFENYQIFDTSSVLRFGSSCGANWGYV